MAHFNAAAKESKVFAFLMSRTRKLLSGLSLALSLSASTVHAQVVPIDGGTFITNSEMVEIYTLPLRMQTVVEGDDNKYYAINYYTYVDPSTGKKDAVPGISNGQWWDDDLIGQFFPWGNDEELAKQLSAGYQDFADANDLLNSDGDLMLNGYDNGGGFIFENWDPKSGGPSGTQRPGNGGSSQGLLYEWNSVKYYTRGVIVIESKPLVAAQSMQYLQVKYRQLAISN